MQIHEELDTRMVTFRYAVEMECKDCGNMVTVHTGDKMNLDFNTKKTLEKAECNCGNISNRFTMIDSPRLDLRKWELEGKQDYNKHTFEEVGIEVLNKMGLGDVEDHQEKNIEISDFIEELKKDTVIKDIAEKIFDNLKREGQVYEPQRGIIGKI